MISGGNPRGYVGRGSCETSPAISQWPDGRILPGRPFPHPRHSRRRARGFRKRRDAVQIAQPHGRQMLHVERRGTADRGQRIGAGIPEGRCVRRLADAEGIQHNQKYPFHIRSPWFLHGQPDQPAGAEPGSARPQKRLRVGCAPNPAGSLDPDAIGHMGRKQLNIQQRRAAGGKAGGGFDELRAGFGDNPAPRIFSSSVRRQVSTITFRSLPAQAAAPPGSLPVPHRTFLPWPIRC